ncbi:unnamed protein product [Microthlaspi erraticum]|uniref:Uncharacterized protein n=1 Tax=Microthlaspi erraticum TaxID=1685480 RepID=A0A6D2K6Y8_9BRAS|nr:unnamed protein product [Microthlaspi erraticum]
MIGRSSVILLGLPVFGIKHMWVIFNLSSNVLDVRKLFTYMIISSLTMCHERWKNKAVIPSGPDAFSGCIINKASRTSASVARRVKSSFSRVVTRSGRFSIKHPRKIYR